MEFIWKPSKEDIKELAKEVAAVIKTDKESKRHIIIPTDQEIQYNVSDVALMSKQSKQTIARHCRDGLLIGSKVGKSWKITQENYLKYINNEN